MGNGQGKGHSKNVGLGSTTTLPYAPLIIFQMPLLLDLTHKTSTFYFYFFIFLGRSPA
jgi:hypothetical protein